MLKGDGASLLFLLALAALAFCLALAALATGGLT
jgi:hypothetical protein